MTNQALTTVDAPQQLTKLPTIMAGAQVRAIVPQDFDSAWRIANAVCKAGMAPRGLETAEKAMVAIMHGLEIGLTPMNALQSIAVVNGRPTIWGDGAIGLARGSGLLEWMEEKFEGKEFDDTYRAVCIVKRRGEPKPITADFSVGDAKTSGLWTKTGRNGEKTPWQHYPKRMLKMRARAFALRDGFADVLKGLAIKEEVDDYATAPRDALPAREEPPAPPLPPQIAANPTPNTAPESKEPPSPASSSSAVGNLPDPAADPEMFLSWLDQFLGEITDPGELQTAWNEKIEPIMPNLFPPDQEEAMGLYRRHEARLAP